MIEQIISVRVTEISDLATKISPFLFYDFTLKFIRIWRDSASELIYDINCIPIYYLSVQTIFFKQSRSPSDSQMKFMMETSSG